VKSAKFATRQKGPSGKVQWVEETWIPCKEFARRIGRPYTTCLRWFRRKWVPAVELGVIDYTCITPWPRALKAYQTLLKSGVIRKPQPRQKRR
jgi:hypothetical protein